MVRINCRYCKKEFFVIPARLKRTPNPCCSKRCIDKWFSKNYEGYWKGKKMPEWAKENMRKSRADFSGSNNGRWHGGKTKKDGYIFIYNREHPAANQRGYVREHRLVIEHSIGRYLKHGEVIHHINGIKDDNRLENLKLFSSHGEHLKYGKHKRNKKRAT